MIDKRLYYSVESKEKENSSRSDDDKTKEGGTYIYTKLSALRDWTTDQCQFVSVHIFAIDAAFVNTAKNY